MSIDLPIHLISSNSQIDTLARANGYRYNAHMDILLQCYLAMMIIVRHAYPRKRNMRYAVNLSVAQIMCLMHQTSVEEIIWYNILIWVLWFVVLEAMVLIKGLNRGRKLPLSVVNASCKRLNRAGSSSTISLCAGHSRVSLSVTTA